MLSMAVDRSSSGKVTKSQQNPKGKGQFWVFSLLKMHCNAFAENEISREGDDGSAQCKQSVIYDCLVKFCKATGCRLLNLVTN